MANSRNRLFVLIQTIVLLVLIASVVSMCFGSIFTIDVDIEGEMKLELQDAIHELTGTTTKIPSKIDVNLFTYFKSIASIFTLIDTIEDTIEDDDDDDSPKKMRKDEAKALAESLTFAYVFVARIASAGDQDGSEYAIASAVGEALIGLFTMVFIFVTILIILISSLIATIKGIVGIAGSNRDLDKLSAQLNSALMRVIRRFPSILVALILSREISLGLGLKGIVIVGLLTVALGAAASRMKRYNEADLAFLNVTQFISVGSLIGLVLFVIGVLKTDLFGACIHALLRAFVGGASNVFIAFFFVPFIIVTLSFAIKSIMRILPRLGCISQSNDYINLPHAIIATLTVVFTTIFNAVSDSLDTIGLGLTSSEKSGLVMVTIGLIIMLAAEIVLKVFVNKLCNDCPEKVRLSILNGSYKSIEPEETEEENYDDEDSDEAETSEEE